MTFDPAGLVIEPWHIRWLSGDWGFADDCVIHWHAIDENRHVTTYRELKFNKTTPDQIAHAIGEANRGEKIALFPFSPDAFAQRTSVRTIADEMAGVLRGYGIPAPSRADDDRVGGWVLLYQTLKSGNWRISRACPELIKALPLLQRKDTNLEDVDDSPVDHAPDSARYGLKTYLRSRPRRDELIERFVMERLAQEGKPVPSPGGTIDRTGQVVEGGRVVSTGAIDWNRVAMVSRQAEAKYGRRQFRPKARGYGRVRR